MRTLHSVLHLQHHRHTGKLLHHQHTSYHALVIVLALAGVFMAWLHFEANAAAEEFGVQAMVLGPVPAAAPIISSPDDGSTTSKGSVLVDGICPMSTPQVVISVSVDAQVVGTSACNGSNDFAVPVPLSSGSHMVTATALTIDGRTGSSSGVKVTSTSSSALKPVTVKADHPFLYAGSKEVTWTGTIGSGSGSSTQYVHVDWGDGNQNDYAVSPGPVDFTHEYSALISHNILLTAADTAGNATSIQYGAAAYSVFTQPAVATTSATSTGTIAGLYGLYITATSVTGIVWLEARHAAKQTL